MFLPTHPLLATIIQKMSVSLANDPMGIVGKKILENGRFTSCNNDEDRIKLVTNRLLKYSWREDNWPSEWKSAQQSEMLRVSGNDMLKSPSPNLEKVLACYTKSILYAPPQSEQLSLSYANRSAVLSRGKYYKECLEDIDRALKNGYPDNLKPKLLIRKVTCNYALTGNVHFETDEALMEARSLVEKLPATDKMRKMVEDTINNPEKITSIGREVKKIPQKYVLEIKGKNPLLPGASDAIALKYSKEYGRHLVATRDIKSGEILIIEKPYATIVEDEWIHSICGHCTKRTWNSVPCDHCIHAMFCSDECKHAAWSEYHDIECQVLGPTISAGYKFHSIMGLRLTVKAIKEAGSCENLKKRLRKLDSLKDAASDIEIPIDPNSYETIYTMLDHANLKSLGELILWSENSAEITYYLATRTELFGQKFGRDLKIVKESEWFPFVAGLMSKNMRIAKTRLTGRSVENGENTESGQMKMLVPIYSFLNHRCYNPVRMVPFDENMVLIAPVPISKGDQIFTNYSHDFKNTSRDSRVKLYEEHFHFACDCLACKEHWSDSTCTSCFDQNLSPGIKDELGERIRRIQSTLLGGFKNFNKLISCKQQCCNLMDFMYPRVKKPCSEVEATIDTIMTLYEHLGSSSYPRFGGDL